MSSSALSITTTFSRPLQLAANDVELKFSDCLEAAKKIAPSVPQVRIHIIPFHVTIFSPFTPSTDS